MKLRETKIGWKKNIDKLIFIFASLYLISVFTWFWKQQQQSIASSNAQSSSSQTESNPSSTETDAEISLAQEQKKDLLAKKIENQISQKLDTLPASPQNKNIELVSIVDKEKPSLSAPQLPPPLPSASVKPPPPPKLLPSPAPLPVTNPPPPELQTAANQPQKLKQLPVIDTLNQDQLISQQPSSLPSSYPLAGQNLGNNTLVGIVELENNLSIALFNVNNLTQRVEVGTEIGATGWLLVGIKDKQVIINRQNQSLYLSVGEQF